jgi:NADH-quinone oxidoreductase subunit B
MYGILKLRNMVMAKPDEGWRSRYGGGGTEEFDPKEIEVDQDAVNVAANPLGRAGTSA